MTAEKTAIGARVRELRRMTGMTTGDLAEAAGVSQAQVSRLETGRHGFRSATLARLAKALAVPPFRLLMTEAEWKRYLAGGGRKRGGS